MKLKIISMARHRNGVCGEPFEVALFKDRGPEGSRKVAILFEQPRYCAVLDVAKLAAGDIEFGSNSWRGDNYEPHLRQALTPTRAGCATSSSVSPTVNSRPTSSSAGSDIC